MNLKVIICLTYVMLQLAMVHCKGKGKKPTPFKINNPDPRFDNPNYIRDRYRNLIKKPEILEMDMKNKHRPFNEAWMDYCDPYHCNDYHKTACGLNRNKMKFKWFQSTCHLILNNMCATYRGLLKYDVVENKYCMAYVMFVRSGCEPCTDDEESPICAMSVTDNHVVLFKNECVLKTANCAPATLDEYKKVDMQICTMVHLQTLSVDTFDRRSSRIIDTLNPFNNTIDSTDD